MTIALPSPNATPPDAPKRPRRSWSVAEQATYVADFAASGLSATAFCRRLGIRRATLARWRQRAAAAPHALVPSAPVASPLTRRLRAATGIEAECAGLDVATAAALVRAVLTPATATPP